MNRQDLWKRSIRSLLLSSVLLGAIGCTTGSDSSLFAATGSDQPLTAEQHLVAATSYDREARSQAEDAERYQQMADSLSPERVPSSGTCDGGSGTSSESGGPGTTICLSSTSGAGADEPSITTLTFPGI